VLTIGINRERLIFLRKHRDRMVLYVITLLFSLRCRTRDIKSKGASGYPLAAYSLIRLPHSCLEELAVFKLLDKPVDEWVNSTLPRILDLHFREVGPDELLAAFVIDIRNQG